MKTILVPTDFSKNALNAMKYAYAYAEKTQSKIVILHTYVNPTSDLIIPMTNLYYDKQEARIEAEEQVKKTVRILAKTFPNNKVKWLIQSGVASDHIVEYSIQHKISLIIMGTSGQGAVSRVLFGSTTSHVMANAHCDMMVIPPKARFIMPKKVAFATDLQKDNLMAAAASVALAKQFNAEMMLMMIQEQEFFDTEDMSRQMKITFRNYCRYKYMSFHVLLDTHIIHGLELFIKRHKPDVLAMATHSYKFPETIWKTSWTNKMANQIQVPLLVIHTTKKVRINKTLAKHKRL